MPELLHPGVYVRELPSGVRPIEGVSTSTAAFIGVTEKGPIPNLVTKLPNGRVAVPQMVTSMTEYFRRYGGFMKDSFMSYAVRSFYENGGRRLYIVRVAPRPNPANAGGAASVSPLAATGALGQLKLSAANEGVWGNSIFVNADESTSSPGNTAKFRLTVYYGEKVEDALKNIIETFDDLDVSSDKPNYFKSVINNRSEYIAIVNDPTKPAEAVTQAPTKQTSPVPLKGGTEGTGPVSFVGDPQLGTGLNALDGIMDVNLVAIPGRGDNDTVARGVEYCKNRPLKDCFFIGDVGLIESAESARTVGAATSVVKVADAAKFSKDFTAKASGDFGSVYFPWVVASDPRGAGRNPRILLPPSGFLAGIFARVDNSRGVFKAPAGTIDGGVSGALDVATPVSDTEQDTLNPVGINVVRTVPTSGIVVWGTRTIGADAEWRYIPVRRMAIFLRVSIYYGIQWAVFEPNDEPLWAALRLNIRAFMLTQFRAGAFQGSKPDDAFFVKCDSTTTTQTDIDNGVVNILVGFAPLKPAEFVVLTLIQKVNQPAA